MNIKTQELHHLDAAAQSAARLLKAMAHPCRLRVLCALAEREYCVGDLQTRAGLSQSALSQHLARLRAQGLVTTRRESQTVYYRIHSAEASAIVAVLARLFCPSPSSSSK